MSKKAVLFVMFVGLSASTLVLAEDPKPKLGAEKFDKAKVFEKLDANTDGSISKAEFKEFRKLYGDQLKERMKGKLDGKFGGKLQGKLDDAMMERIFDMMFEKIDTNMDQKISKEEFEKFEPGKGLDSGKLKGLKGKFGKGKFGGE